MSKIGTSWWRRADPVAAAVLGLAGLILLVFLVYPISRIILNSFFRVDEPLRLASLTLEHFGRFASSSLYRKALVHSLTASLAASLLALCIGLPMAFFVARVRIPGKTVLPSLVLTTLIYFQIVGYFDLNAAGAIALVSVGFTAISLFLLHHLSQRRGYITVTGATRAARELQGRGIRVVAMAYCVLVLAVSLVPHLMILMTSFAETWGRGRCRRHFPWETTGGCSQTRGGRCKTACSWPRWPRSPPGS